MESLVDQGKCRAIGLSDISLNHLLPMLRIRQNQAGRGPGGVAPVPSGNELLEFCKEKGIVLLAFDPWVME